jgi:hypothetical protein
MEIARGCRTRAGSGKALTVLGVGITGLAKSIARQETPLFVFGLEIQQKTWPAVANQLKLATRELFSIFDGWRHALLFIDRAP